MRGYYGHRNPYARYGRVNVLMGAEPPKPPAPNWMVAIIAGGAGVLAHMVWGVLNKAKTRYRWTAPR